MSKSKLRVRALVPSMAVAMLLTACQNAENAAQPAAEASDAVMDAAADAAAPEGASASAAPGDAGDVRIDPAIAGGVASGVAFTYSAQYRLPDAAVSEAQSRHVAACAALGRAHCRVGDIRFDQRSEGPVSGSLQLLIDPALARGFLRDAERMVAALNGETLASSIAGEDVGTGIAAGGTRQQCVRDPARGREPPAVVVAVHWCTGLSGPALVCAARHQWPAGRGPGFFVGAGS